MSQTREAIWQSSWSACFKVGETFGSRHHNFLLYDLRQSNIILLSLNLLSYKTISCIVMEIKCGNEHKILAQCLAHRKGCCHFFFLFIHVIIIITMSQNSRVERAVDITKISLLYA